MNYLKALVPPPGFRLKPYEWMIKATPQQEWIDEKGVFLWLAFFFSEIGAGLYFLSLFYSYRTGLVLGWLITLGIGGGVHMLYLGNPKRFWRIFMKPASSELSRGVWIITIFALMGFIQVVSGSFNSVLNVIMGILCILIVMHGFATMNVMRALPAWSSTLVLPLSIVSGVWVGSQILQFMLCISNPAVAAGFEVWAELLLLVYIGLLALYLWGTFHSSDIARVSINQLFKGDMSRLFYIGVVGVGLVLPLLLTLIMWGGSVNAFLVLIRLLLVFVGDLIMRYVLMKSAVYTPLM
ncbi:MAG: DMSO reductase [Pseudomonadota bacterium]